MTRTLLLLLVGCSLWAAPTVSILTTDNRVLEGQLSARIIKLEVGGKTVGVDLAKVLSIHNGAGLSASEQERVTKGIPAILGTDRAARDLAVEDLSSLGVALITPLLKAYKDTDFHEPNPLYRLFARIMPSYADSMDRSLSMVRLVGGDTLRGKLMDAEFTIGATKITAGDVRRLAVRQAMVVKKFEAHSLRHSTQIEYLDAGVWLAATSQVTGKARGLVRLSWETDGWASDADGLKVPGPNYKTNLVDGFPFGALVGKVGAAGDNFMAGVSLSKKGFAAGRLYFAVNDNKHWQNNLGSFWVELRVADAYDIGDAQ